MFFADPRSAVAERDRAALHPETVFFESSELFVPKIINATAKVILFLRSAKKGYHLTVRITDERKFKVI